MARFIDTNGRSYISISFSNEADALDFIDRHWDRIHGASYTNNQDKDLSSDPAGWVVYYYYETSLPVGNDPEGSVSKSRSAKRRLIS